MLILSMAIIDPHKYVRSFLDEMLLIDPIEEVDHENNAHETGYCEK